jgi:hypothetical protein
MASNRLCSALAAFITADSLVTFAVSAAVLCIFKCDNSLCTAGIIAAGVFVVQGLAAALICCAVQDFSETVGGEDR